MNNNNNNNNHNNTGNNSETGAVVTDGVEFLLCGLTFPKSAKLLKDRDIWIADTGASVHTTPHKYGMENLKTATPADAITVGNGTTENTGVIGDLPGVICDKYDNELANAKMTNVTVMPNGGFNLFSVTKMQKDGWLLHGDSTCIELSKGEARIKFDIAIPTARGLLFAMCFKRQNEVVAVGVDKTTAKPMEKPVRMNINEAHRKFGHGHEDAVRKAAKHLGIEITRGTMKPCLACTKAKAKQKNVPKVSFHVVGNKDERLVFLDLASIKQPKDGPSITKQHWCMVVDEHSTCSFTTFHETKKDMIEPVCKRFNRWRQAGHAVKMIRMDNAGKNKGLEQCMNGAAWKLDIDVEYTARDTPQQNHLAELSLAKIASKGQALMASANVPQDMCYRLFREAMTTATLLDNLMVVNVSGKEGTRFEHFTGKNTRFASHLRTWGEAGTVKLKTKATPKIGNQGEQCMFVGYATDHTGNTYCMWNPQTGPVHVTRDIIWLKQMYFQRPATTVEAVVMPTAVSPIASGESTDTGVDAMTTAPTPVAAAPVPMVTAGNNYNNYYAVLGDDDDDNDPTDEEDSEEESSDDEDEKDDELLSGTVTEHVETKTSSGRVSRAPSRLIEECGVMLDVEQGYHIGLTNSEAAYYAAMREIR